jgi:hypothetical protein
VSFLYALALATVLLVAAPYVAHRLRRKRADERPFAAARLVPPAPPKARRRSKLEDRALFAVRALAVAALAVLGATPLVRCSRLSLQRSGGASVALALVIDDSMSMRAPVPGGGGSRFDRARKGADELLASAREGDAVAVVLAGAPPRVALAATTDLAAARSVLEALAPNDRATDLEGAVSMARGLVASLPQVDRRVVVLSDLADGHPDAPPLGEGGTVPVWVALPELRGDAGDCAVLTADRAGDRVRARVACNGLAAPHGRELLLRDGEKVLARAPFAPASGRDGALAQHVTDVSLVLPAEATGDLPALTVALSGQDAVAADDSARVVTETGPGAVAVVADTAEEAAATGGAPVVEQALAALALDVAVRPVPILPDRTEDLAPFRGLILDDPPGFTPEQRHALSAFLEQGGVVLLALGPRAAAAPLGATLEPVLTRAVAWEPTTVPGADVGSGAGPFGESVASLEDLAVKKRAVLAPEDARSLEPLVRWKDGAPLVGRRSAGRGQVWVITLPFALEQSDLSLRPAFLSLLDGWVDEAHARMAQRRSEVGSVWSFPGVGSVSARGPAGSVDPTRGEGVWRLSPPLVGPYDLVVDDKPEVRVAAPVLRELDFRPRAAPPEALAKGMGDTHAAVDVSWVAALVLLGLMTIELALRVSARVMGAHAPDGLRKHAVLDEARGP